jgi:hypothetical protein
MNPIRTPYGLAAPDDPPLPDTALLRALCGDMALIEAEQTRMGAEQARQGAEQTIIVTEQARISADSAHQGAEIGRLTAALDAALRRITAMERRRPRRRGALR